MSQGCVEYGPRQSTEVFRIVNGDDEVMVVVSQPRGRHMFRKACNVGDMGGRGLGQMSPTMTMSCWLLMIVSLCWLLVIVSLCWLLSWCLHLATYLRRNSDDNTRVAVTMGIASKVSEGQHSIRRLDTVPMVVPVKTSQQVVLLVGVRGKLTGERKSANTSRTASGSEPVQQ